mmetsp:Transcript_40249/g.96438  ORF Transcript_40249/g.96438 Transcript_40249/m.96438 type:complete len:207 (+) Transcript_40249:1047-1667(+)
MGNGDVSLGKGSLGAVQSVLVMLVLSNQSTTSLLAVLQLLRLLVDLLSCLAKVLILEKQRMLGSVQLLLKIPDGSLQLCTFPLLVLSQLPSAGQSRCQLMALMSVIRLRLLLLLQDQGELVSHRRNGLQNLDTFSSLSTIPKVSSQLRRILAPIKLPYELLHTERHRIHSFQCLCSNLRRGQIHVRCLVHDSLQLGCILKSVEAVA